MLLLHATTRKVPAFWSASRPTRIFLESAADPLPPLPPYANRRLDAAASRILSSSRVEGRSRVMQSRGREDDSKCQMSSFELTIIHDRPFCVSKPPMGGDKEAAKYEEAEHNIHITTTKGITWRAERKPTNILASSTSTNGEP